MRQGLPPLHGAMIDGMAAVTLDIFAAFCEYDHALAVHCSRCQRWTVVDLADSSPPAGCLVLYRSAPPLLGLRFAGFVAGASADDKRANRSRRGLPSAIRLASSAASTGSRSAWRTKLRKAN